jgi:hypothetical protein
MMDQPIATTRRQMARIVLVAFAGGFGLGGWTAMAVLSLLLDLGVLR